MDQKQLIDELTQGKEFARQLQIHLDNHPSSSSHEIQEILIHNILNSYDKSLSLLITAARRRNAHGVSNGEQSYLHAVMGMGITRLESFSESPPSQDSNGEFKDPDHKDFAVAKSRKSNGSMEKWKHQVKVRADMGFEEALDDGHSWRKYGQKDILGAKYPRGYYRCTYRQVEGCLATKQVQIADEDPNIVDITYLGSHTCNDGSHTTSTLPLLRQSPPSPEVQHPSQQNQLPRSPEILPTFQTSLKVVTDNLDNPSFHFPSTSNSNFIFPTLHNTFECNTSPSFISPATMASTYFTMSQSRGSAVGENQNAVVIESKLNDVVSGPTSSTSSPNVDVGFTFGQLEFGNNFNFDNSIFFD